MLQPKASSLDDLGLQVFLDERYYKYGGFVRWLEMYDAGESDIKIAQAFSSPERPLSRQTSWSWRKKWEAERKEVAR